MLTSTHTSSIEQTTNSKLAFSNASTATTTTATATATATSNSNSGVSITGRYSPSNFYRAGAVPSESHNRRFMPSTPVDDTTRLHVCLSVRYR
jgi:hypothetical protein